ncbi:sugar phosphate isomerase/epimerase family protein [Methanocaldococcus infernus]|nr:sugar phosphate isomerase/epimerase [Methanocaldococcus infernus]
MIGICSYLVSEITNKGFSLDELKVNCVELGFSDIPLLDKDGEINREAIDYLSTLNVKYTLHSPTSDEPNSVCVDLGKGERDLKIMENVFKIASLLNIKYVVIHGGDINGSYHKAYINTLRALKSLINLANEYSVKIVLENLCDNRIGAFPHEFSGLLDDEIGVTLDVGHAYLMCNKYGMSMREYFKMLRPYIEHVHLHDNFGFVDNHLPLGEGNINWKMVLNELRKCKVKNLILEIRNYYNEMNVKNSIKLASKGYKKRYVKRLLLREIRVPYIN